MRTTEAGNASTENAGGSAAASAQTNAQTSAQTERVRVSGRIWLREIKMGREMVSVMGFGSRSVLIASSLVMDSAVSASGATTCGHSPAVNHPEIQRHADDPGNRGRIRRFFEKTPQILRFTHFSIAQARSKPTQFQFITPHCTLSNRNCALPITKPTSSFTSLPTPNPGLACPKRPPFHCGIC
nr:hypothetical protein [Verrucomicrobiota bacterium JB025]